MIKIYFDWNVLSQIRAGQYSALWALINKQGKFFIIYSTAHISDILSSASEDHEQRAIISADLEFISKLTNNFCAYHVEKEVTIGKRNPQDLFEGQLDVKDLLIDLNINKLFSQIDNPDDEVQALVDSLSNIFKNIQIDPIFKDALEDPVKREQMNKFLPGLEQNLTMEGLLNAIINMFKNLNDGEDYKILRENIQKGLGINRDRMFDTANPHKSIEQSYEKLGFDFEHPEIKKNGPKWFDDIVEEYLKLDMHGYQEDRIRIDKGRKETFKNTTNDAFHVGYASMCDFFITNDSKSIKKSKAVYQKLGIDTRIFKPTEFVEYYNENMHIDTVEKHLALFHEILKSKQFMEVVGDGKISRIYKLSFFIFDYFNKVYMTMHLTNDVPTILLTKDKPTNNRFTFAVELKNLIDKLMILFGNDLEKIGAFEQDELLESNWIGRTWSTEMAKYRLIMINGYCQLYMDIDPEKLKR